MNGMTYLNYYCRCVFVGLTALIFVSRTMAQTPQIASPSAPPVAGATAPNSSAADEALLALQKQARTLELEAAAQAKAGQLARAQLLYGQAAVLYHREARLARQEALTLTAAGNASAAAARHTLALAADNHFLHSMASEVALIKKQSVQSARSPKPVRPVKPMLPRKPVVAALPPAPAVVVTPVPHVKPPKAIIAKHAPGNFPPRSAASLTQLRPILTALRYQAVFHLLQASRIIALTQKPIRHPDLPPKLAKRVPPPAAIPLLPVTLPPAPEPIAVAPPAAAPPVAPVKADFSSGLWSSSPWSAVQEVLVDRTFENGAPTLLQISGPWIFRQDGTWQREVRTANGIVFPAHGTYSVSGSMLTLVTHLDAGGLQTTVYRFAESASLHALSLVTTTVNGYERTLLYAHGTEAEVRSPESLDALAPRP